VSGRARLTTVCNKLLRMKCPCGAISYIFGSAGWLLGAGDIDLYVDCRRVHVAG
jgi:hypothetical protein